MVKTTLANSAWWLASSSSYAAFAAALDDPMRAQEAILRQFIHKNSKTAFGREHGFAEIRAPEQFAERVPARDYDELRPWIERVRRGEPQVLTSEPVRRLVPTSGSTAARKLIPYTASMQRQLNQAIGPWIFDLYRRQPRALLGPSYWAISPLSQAEFEATEDSAVPIGFDDDAAYLGGWRQRIVETMMAVPATLKSIASIEDWRYVTLLLLLRRRDLSLISIWHPSFLKLLLDAMPSCWDRLVNDVAQGTCAVNKHLPSSMIESVEAHPDPRRADELRETDPVAIHRVWPQLQVISCWADGHAASAASELAQLWPSIAIQPKGLLATEGVISIPFAGQHPLAIRSHFLEFEDDAGHILLAADLQVGRAYAVILTTAGGLCRYRLNDRVEVVGMLGCTPSIRFVGKVGLVSDRRGEKLTDGFVAQVLARLFASWNHRPSFVMLAPDNDAEGCRYTLYVNADISPELSLELDALLSANPQYAYCRRLAQLHAPRLFRLAGDPYVQYCHRLQQAGQRLGDIKPVALSCLDDWSDYFHGAYTDSNNQ